jgi:hypothetical protein
VLDVAGVVVFCESCVQFAKRRPISNIVRGLERCKKNLIPHLCRLERTSGRASREMTNGDVFRSFFIGSESCPGSTSSITPRGSASIASSGSPFADSTSSRLFPSKNPNCPIDRYIPACAVCKHVPLVVVTRFQKKISELLRMKTRPFFVFSEIWCNTDVGAAH